MSIQLPIRLKTPSPPPTGTTSELAGTPTTVAPPSQPEEDPDAITPLPPLPTAWSSKAPQASKAPIPPQTQFIELPIRSKTPSPPPTGTTSKPADTSTTVAPPSQPEEGPDAITPLPPATASSSKAPQATNRPTTSGEKFPGPVDARPALSIPTWPAHLTTHLSTLLTRPWDHPLQWDMPASPVLYSTFNPFVASILLSIEHTREGKCFCILALQAAQMYINNISSDTIILTHRPHDLADYYATLNLFLSQESVEVFQAECERYEDMYGKGTAEIYVRRQMMAEHVSVFLEQVAAGGTAIRIRPEEEEEVRGEGEGGEEERLVAGQETVEEGKENGGRLMRRTRSFFQRVGEKVGDGAKKLRHDSVLSPKLQKVLRRRER